MHNLREKLWEMLFVPPNPSDPNSLSIMEALAEEYQAYCLKFAAVLVFIFIGYKVMLYMADINSKLDPFVIVRPFLILATIVLYRELVDVLLFIPSDIINGIVEDGLQFHTGGTPGDTSYNNIFLDKMKFVDPAFYVITALNATFELIHLLIIFIASAIGAYILVRQVILAAIYYLLGVFAIPFSLIVGNQSVLGNWFFGFLSILMWLPIFNIIMGIIKSLDIEGITYGNPLFSVGVQIAFVGIIMQVPKFANILVSKGADATKGGGVIAGAVGGAAGVAKYVAQQSIINRMNNKKK